MKYLIRINPKAVNPLTGKIDPRRLWEVEQCANKDSAKVIWHCADIRIGTKPIYEIFKLPAPGEPAKDLEFFGICVRGQDNAIEIHEGRHEVG
jgi:hypothetical protein